MLRRNVLILHQAALGDFVLTWPLALAMGRLYPQSRIFYVTSREKGRLAEKAIRVESTDIESGWHPLFAEKPTLADAPARLLTGAHTVMSFLGRTGDVVGGNLRRLAPAANVVELSTQPTQPDQHVTDQLLLDLQSQPAAAEAVRQILRSLADRGLAGHKPIARSVVLHPGSGAARKNWPIGSFIQLARRLQAAGRSIRIVIGEVEREQFAAADLTALLAAGELVEPRDLVSLYDTLATAEAFIGNDSGPGHLAAMLGCRTVAIAAGEGAGWRPIGPRVHLVRGRSLDAISVESVAVAATA